MNAAKEQSGAQHFSVAPGQKTLLVICCIVFAGLAAMMVVVAGAFGGLTAGSLIVLVSALVIVALFVHIMEEAFAAFRLRINLTDSAVALRLPRRRGLARLPAVDASVALTDIAGVETRAEVFSQIGAAAIQRAFRITLKDGGAIELGADRQFGSTVYDEAARAIAARAGVEIADRGMVDGAPGFLAVLGAQIPGWDAPPLDEDARRRRYAASARALRWVTMVVLIASAARFLGRR